MRKTQFVNNEYYHIFNRGVDKRKIFLDQNDMKRFFQSINEFNVLNPIGSIYENQFIKSKNKQNKLVNFICYCLNPNHYHFILEQCVDSGIEKFMHKFGTGYTKYFNHKYKRSGSLFQGNFKSVYIDSNEQLLHVSAYVNLNYKVHQLGSLASKSSWNEYVKNDNNGFCKKEIILSQFNNPIEYKNFTENSLEDIIERKEEFKKMFLLE